MHTIEIKFNLYVDKKTYEKLVQKGKELGQNYGDAGPNEIATRTIMWEGLGALNTPDIEPTWTIQRG